MTFEVVSKRSKAAAKLRPGLKRARAVARSLVRNGMTSRNAMEVVAIGAVAGMVKRHPGEATTFVGFQPAMIRTMSDAALEKFAGAVYELADKLDRQQQRGEATETVH